MTAEIFAVVFAAYGVLLLYVKIRGRRMSTAQLASYVQHVRGAELEALTYRVATDEERRNTPSVNVDGMKELGATATTRGGNVLVSRYLIDETRTIVATRHSAALVVSSYGQQRRYQTYCLKAGLPCAPPGLEREWFPLNASDSKMLVAHRARIAKAGEPLVRIMSIEQLAEIFTELSRRNAEWRATQDHDELFEADLRSILRDSYEARGESVKTRLRKLRPRARVVS